MTVPVLICLAILAVVIAGLVAVAARLSRPHRGRHLPRERRAGFADPADATDPDGSGYLARIRPDHLPRAGCLVTSELLEDPWDLAAQVRPPDPRPLSRLARGWSGTEVMPAASTGEMLAFGHITPAEVADRLARRHLGGER